MAKEITVLVKFRGTVPEDVSIADIKEQIAILKTAFV